MHLPRRCLRPARQAPERFVIHLTDEYSLVVYDFSIAAAGAGSTVACCVECCTCSGEGDAWPSERLARMVERQDGLIAQRLKGSVERAAAAETCTVSVC